MMGWSLGFDRNRNRDIGYGVPAYCEHPRCNERIDRGLAYVCGGEPYGGDHGCGMFFCGNHLRYRQPRGEDRVYQNCFRCATYKPPYREKPEHPEWIQWKLTDPSWEDWRAANPNEVASLRSILDNGAGR